MDERRSFTNLSRDTDVWPLNYRLGMVAWLGQRISGLAIVVYLFMHIFVISSAVWREGGGSFDKVLEYLQSPLFIALDILLLAAVVFHALNGLRILLFDLGIGVRTAKAYFWVLMAIGAVLVLWGAFEVVPSFWAPDFTSRSEPGDGVYIAVEVGNMAIAEKEQVEVELERGPAAARGVWAWLLQRVTAAILLVFVGTHLWVLHYAAAGEHIRLEAVMERLRSPFFAAVDIALLATAIFHALNGFRMVLFDFGLVRGAQKALTLLLWIFGLVALVYGANTLLYLTTGEALFYLRPG